MFQCPHGLELLRVVRAIVNIVARFQCPHGLELLLLTTILYLHQSVSMPSRAWVVTAGMSNILNFLWYFLCIPAIYKCILAYLSIFFNQLSDFLRCESPNTFLGTCLSHHSFIILLITHGLIPHFYDHKSSRGLHGRTRVSMPLGLIPYFYPWQKTGAVCFCGNVSMPSRAYTSFLRG